MPGYWSLNKLIKRGAKDVPTFCGWSTLVQLIESSERPIVKGLMACLFETGGRISEVLQLRKDHFRVNDHFVRFYGVPVLKKGKGASPRERIRNFPVRLDEPLVPYMLDWLKEAEGELLFPRGRNWAYKEITKVNKAWWPHRFRAERATQLVVEYRYNVPLLMRFFNWSDEKIPTQYVKLDIGDLETAMMGERK